MASLTKKKVNIFYEKMDINIIEGQKWNIILGIS